MLETLKHFALEYANPQNVFLLGALLMFLLLLLRWITAFFGLRDLKKINSVLRYEDGDEIIRRIEGLQLSRRFDEMWDDYYTAYCNEDTAALSEYLIISDKFIPTHLCRNLARFVAAASLAGSVAALAFVPGLKERTDIFWLCCACMGAYVLLCEAFFALIEAVRVRRLHYLTDEFRQLSLRKMPGKSVDFLQRYLLQAIDCVRKDMCAGQKQTAQRLDELSGALLTQKDEPFEESEA